jgi:NAD(P)-dependent dehydrogenase (short-subunit alcohol dehydrogenase family)
MLNALITGTSTGIGQATALYLARNGYRVFASMRNPETGAALLADAANEEGLPLHVIQLDVDDPDSVSRAVQEVEQRAGQIDVLVNNAGIAGAGSVEEGSEEVLRAIFETNFFGAMRVTRAVLPGIRQRKSGAIVNVTSVAGRLASPPQFAYAASKFAMEADSEILAQEMRRFNVRVAIIEPGMTLAPMVTKGGCGPNMDSPYVVFSLRIGRTFAKLLEDPSPPELVAVAIHYALVADEPKLRYPVGEDAEGWIVGRERMTDEELVDYGKEMSDDEVADYFLKYFSIEI